MPRATMSEKLLRQAAELRVGGASWDAVARAVGRSAETVRAWPRVYAARWRRATAEAEQQLLSETTAESVLTLRRQLRSEDDKASREAAEKLIRFKLAQSKPSKTTRSHDPPEAEVREESSLNRLVYYLEQLSDADLNQLITQLGQRQGRARGRVVDPGDS